jgi:hypothetical protein
MAEYRHVEQAGQSLGRSFRQVTMFPKRPMVTCSMGVPFVSSMEPPGAGERPPAGQAWVLDAWDPKMASAAADLAVRLGPPDVLSTPSRMVAFPARGRGTLGVRAKIEGLGALEALRIRPTLDRGQIALAWSLSGEFDSKAADRFVLGGELLDAAGAVIERVQTRVSWTGTFSPNAALAWASAPRAAWQRAEKLRVSVWDTAVNRAAAWQVAADLPEGVHITAGRDAVEVELAVCVPWVLEKAKAGAPAPVGAEEQGVEEPVGR